MPQSHSRNLRYTTIKEVFRNSINFGMRQQQVQEYLKNNIQVKNCKMVEFQVPLWSHFLNLKICNYLSQDDFSKHIFEFEIQNTVQGTPEMSH